jgi:hypothetical protein
MYARSGPPKPRPPRRTAGSRRHAPVAGHTPVDFDASPSDTPKIGKKAIVVIVPIALAFLGAIAGMVVAYIAAPQQATRDQAAKEAAQERSDAAKPALLVRGQRYGAEVRSAATFSVLELDVLNEYVDSALDSGRDLISAYQPPGSQAVSPVEGLDDSSVAQPRVYDTMFVTLVGNHYRPVKVNDISVRILERRSPPAGTLILASPQGASPEESLGFDLDSIDLHARVTETGNVPHDTARRYFDERQIELSKFENMELKLSVFTRTCLCHFVFDITTDDGRVVSVDNNGKPWKVSSFASTYDRAYGVDIRGNPYIVRCSWPSQCQDNY